MCRDYEREIPVWPKEKEKKGHPKTRIHSSDYGLGYYLDDSNLRRVSLNQFLLNTSPPKESSTVFAPPPFGRFSSCVIPLAGSMDLFRETVDVYLHVKHFSELYHKKPLLVNRTIETGLHALVANPFGSLLETTKTTNDMEWTIVVSSVLADTTAVRQALPADPRSTLLPGTQLIHNTDGTLLLEVAQVMYQSMYRNEADVPDEAL
jgi:hypothetical protein